MPTLQSTSRSIFPSCPKERRLGWYSPKHERRHPESSRRTKHGATEKRQQDYREAMARLLPEDKAFLRQAKIAVEELTVQQRFLQIASEWSNETRNISSLTAMASHPKYRQIVDLGWDVVPYLIDDLQKNKRYWLPALSEITTIRPYDSADEGNSKTMIDAWVNWGKKKYKNVR